MNFVLFFSVITALLVIATLIILLYFLRKKPAPDDNTSTLLLQRQIETISTQLHEQLGRMSDQMGHRLQENAEAITKTHQSVGERLDNAARAHTLVTNKLSQLEEASKRIEDVGKDISGLQDIFRSPKLRGAIGEHLLADILMQALPAGQYELQYTFKGGDRVDAVIKLRDGLLVPVDSKFPLESLQRSFETQNEQERERLRKQFTSDVKKHIDKIAKTYILPDEGTTPMALMYIPGETVFYEIIVRGETEGKSLVEYAHEHRVIPVSPNTFYTYVQTILLGLRGMQIEKRAQEILQNLGQLRNYLERFGEDYRVLGRHISSASKTYQSGEKRLDKFADHLYISSGNEPPELLVEGEEEKVFETNDQEGAQS